MTDNKRRHGNRKARPLNAAILVAVLTALALMITPGAFAHESEEHGVITIHDEEGGPAVENFGQTHCEWWVRGHGMDQRQGQVQGVAFFASSTDRVSEMERWTGEENPNGTFDFEAGPFADDAIPAPDEIVKVWAYLGGDHRSPWVAIDPEPCRSEPTCPPDVSLGAVSHDDESVTVEADGLDGDAGLERAAAGTGDFEHVATLDEGNTTFRDTGTEAQTTYEYRLVVNGGTCATVEVTAIPVFPGLIVASLATVGGVGAYGAIARHRKD